MLRTGAPWRDLPEHFGSWSTVVGDRAYSYPSVRRALIKRGIRAVIPRRSDQRPFDRRQRFDTAIYPQRNRVERLVKRLK